METLKENSNGQLTIQNLQPPVRRKPPTAVIRPEDRENQQRALAAQEAYGRGKAIQTGTIKDRKLRANLKRLETKYKDAVLGAKDAEILLENQEGFLEPEGELERTYKVRQDEIKDAVGISQAKKSIEFKLDMGPYYSNYTRNGRSLLLAGRKGHVATCEWRAGIPGCELHLNETVRDAKWLHNDQYFAVAQKKYTYIYDHAGVEIHCLRKYVEATHLEFLPYHFLLAGVESSGFLRYMDTSTGQIVAEYPTRKGSPTALAQNPYNAIVHVGHQNGTISLWSPNSTEPLVKVQAHSGPVRAAAIDRQGRYMLSGGQDLKLKLWDIRMYREVHTYHTHQPASAITISDRGLAAISTGTSVTVWKDLFTTPASASIASGTQPSKIQSPYMSYTAPSISPIQTLQFCPFEDLLGIAHSQGFTTTIVPGSGEPNYDSLSTNPYETTKQRQETEVASLLQKLQPETIALNPHFIGNLDTASHLQTSRSKNLDYDPKLEEKQKLERLEHQSKNGDADNEKFRARGKNSALRRHLRKKGGKNIIDEKRMRLEAMRKREKERRERKGKEAEREKGEVGVALGRFIRKG